MTLIIGVEDGDNSYLVSDSGSWSGVQRHVATQPKIWRDGDWLVGSSGNISDQQIIRRCSIGTPIERGLDTEIDWLVSWAAKLQGELYDSVRLINIKDEEPSPPQIIAARRGSVFQIQRCAVTRHPQGFAVAGQHGFGYGAMHGVLEAARKSEITPLDAALQAMRAAYRGTDHVYGQIRVLCTDGTSESINPPTPFEFTIRPLLVRR